ncbi:hypothetical protein OHV73_19195, partial [Acinetobacter baumannii]|nr:hypothetical protein [Acinetobacter baumannii]
SWLLSRISKYPKKNPIKYPYLSRYVSIYFLLLDLEKIKFPKIYNTAYTKFISSINKKTQYF